jgi:hypothetical protein
MKLFGRNHILVCDHFCDLFLMNYIGNEEADKIERALMTALQE